MFVNARCDGAVCRHLAAGSSSSLALSGANIYRLLLSADDTPWTAAVAASVHRHGPHATSQGGMTSLLICSVILCPVIDRFFVYFVFCIFHCISLCLVATLIFCSVYLAIQRPGCKYVIIKLS